ncbi:hypothetical protein [Loktanella sp. SALINAS62]|uniref:hypothetical protein n=1 Tax=Loktanella sp. SALINAS62 TaxID=2706124 RepID=UPI001B8C6F8F|nr:hypothetical protein [Loktanella sp. SALINAS62]MBS1303409.1 hypothetical protein [Loktanella sp. SALINAS62]
MGGWTLAVALETAGVLGITRDLLTRARAADIALSAGVIAAAATGLADMRQIHGRD